MNRIKISLEQLLLIFVSLSSIVIIILLVSLYQREGNFGNLDYAKIKKKYPAIFKSKDTMNMKGMPPFYKPIDPKTASDGVDAFRDLGDFGSYFITYDTCTFNEYMSKFREQIAKQARKIGEDSCWQIGFYPYLKNVGTGSSEELIVDFAVIPTIVPKDEETDCIKTGRMGGGADYFKKIKNAYDKSAILAFDYGNMHP